MKDSLGVYLHGIEIGDVIRLNDGRIIFEFNDRYVNDPNSPVLSQSFMKEDGGVRTPTRAAAAGLVPPFFSNLLPEGPLRTYLARLAGVSEQREFEMLELLGRDLPGAVVVHRKEGVGETPSENDRFDEATTSKPLRFSLAGVQLKFSAIKRAGGGLTIPAQGIGGDWIVKLPSVRHERVPENEYSVMSMARRVGIDVPEMRLVPLDQIGGLPPEVADLNEPDAFVLRRFDRDSGRRIHMEDFAQATGTRPIDKYISTVNYTDLTRLVERVCGENDVLEFSRRLMFNAIVGNGDMHLKNWSFIYKDGRTAELTPAYDFLCTTVYIDEDDAALKIRSTKEWNKLSLDDFAGVAEGAGVDRKTFVDAAVETAIQFMDHWVDSVKSLPVDDQLKTAIDHQITTCPAIKAALRKSVPTSPSRTPELGRD